ncbi:MAG: hypothetical protein A2W91_16260 [Bacteroidetes bacterium GWF2_38_335]|nr:MAG: hypothetical protein A2W91_16260 [Bacteroidetes bacterium GWF2_38_335]OFY81243.1 MAG: hypothetical protein A2281_07235 [Bacteroidetes bacterium RIFOXYA12_FULL_38_20]HBS85360.1 hypothetical protein [Bacteroidales bacterium]
MLIVFSFLFEFCFAQGDYSYSKAKEIENCYGIFQQYTDPVFPVYDESGDKDSQRRFINEMEVYAKNHPPCPVMQNTGNSEYDMEAWQNNVDNWFTQYRYFPRYIPYHLYNNKLTPQDDEKFFFAAVKLWIKKNPDLVESTPESE